MWYAKLLAKTSRYLLIYMLNRKILFLCSWIFLGLIQPCFVFADIVVLKNHNEMEGIIVSENDQSVVLKVRSGNITFPKSQIKSIILDREQGQKTLESSSQESPPEKLFLTLTQPRYTSKYPIDKINKKIGDAHGIEIRKDQFFIDGKSFFIRGVGYSPMRPGMSPGQEITEDLYKRDFERIRHCGFNTIRLWGKGSELLLKTALEYDLYVIQAIWIDPGGTFDYSGFIYQSVAHARMMAEMSKPYPNVLMYLVMNEPHVKKIMKAGPDKTLDLLRQVRDAVKSVDPDRPISISNFVSTVWLDQELWDVVCFNAYGYYPLSINKDMGYFGYLTWLKDQYAADKPLLITEYGYSVSPTGPGGFGYGGNTEDEQARGLVNNFDAISQSGAIGGCLFEWCDEWWKSGNPGIHDDHPEEWFGLVSFKGLKDKEGNTRKAYEALISAMKMAVLHPRQHSVFFDKIPLAMNVTSDIDKLEYQFEDGEWMKLLQPSPWFKQDIDVTSLEEGPHQLRVRALIGQTEVTKKIISFVKSTKSSLNPPYQLTLLLDKESYVVGDELRLQLLVKDSDLQPVRNVPVSLSLFNCLTSNSRRWTGHTDKNGMFSQSYLALGGRFDWYYLVTAGAQQKYLGTKFPLSAVKTVFVEGGLKHIVRKNVDIPKRISGIVIDGKLEPY